jgi:hypothetical protein
MTGMGPVAVAAPDARATWRTGRTHPVFVGGFNPYARRLKSLEILVPILYSRALRRRLRGGPHRAAREGCGRAVSLEHRGLSGRRLGYRRKLKSAVDSSRFRQ